MVKIFIFLLLACSQFLHATAEDACDQFPAVRDVTAKQIDVESINIATLDQDLISQAIFYFSGQNMMAIVHEDLTEIKMDNNGICYLVGLAHVLLTDITFMDENEKLTELLSENCGPSNLAYRNFAYIKPLIAKIKIERSRIKSVC